jgi:hypothetical protein
MLKKKITIGLLAIFTSFLFLGLVNTPVAYAAGPNECTSNANICFIPNVVIPGITSLPGVEKCSETRQVLDKNGKIVSDTKNGYKIDNCSIANYIKGLYNYTAGIAGVVAIFMIVFAAWQWIMAAGNAGKIDTAKDTIRGALIGLALIFGGYLLMNSISEKLVSFDSLQIQRVLPQQMAKDICSALLADGQFGSLNSCGTTYATSTNGFSVNCVDNTCPASYRCYQYSEYEERIGDCPTTIDEGASVSCSCAQIIPCHNLLRFDCGVYNLYEDHYSESCAVNLCYGETMADDETVYPSICGLSRAGICLPAANSNLPGDMCDSNSDCILDLDGDHVSEYCCDEDVGFDQCELITWVNEHDGHNCYHN